MTTAMGTIFFLVNLEMFFILHCMASMSTILAPNHELFVESFLTYHTKKITLALSLRN